MTTDEFARACAERYIDPNIALENENVKQALRERDDNKVIKLLEEEF